MNLPIILRCSRGIFRSRFKATAQEISDNLPMYDQNLPILCGLGLAISISYLKLLGDQQRWIADFKWTPLWKSPNAGGLIIRQSSDKTWESTDLKLSMQRWDIRKTDR